MFRDEKLTKKILIVDDSALMRRVLCDIIESDERFKVEDKAINGVEAFDLLSRKKYDAVVMDINMPRMDGLELLRELRKYKIQAKVLVASTDTADGTKTTLDALELGALDCVHKPGSAVECRVDSFKEELLNTLNAVVNSRTPSFDVPEPAFRKPAEPVFKKPADPIPRRTFGAAGSKIVAIASSTGGPKALQALIPKLPKNLDAPVLIVQHMPKGFTASMAERLNELSELNVKEGAEGEELSKGTVYVAMSGQHMNVKTTSGGRMVIHYTDEPNREGVKPCANYMYESLADSSYDQVVCVVMTGMGADGTEGIRNLKPKKNIYVIAQNQATSTVYGMPKSVVAASLADRELPLEQIAQEIVANVGVR